ncbi:MAG: membrane integrity-associated transporter subunit PqiC [Planctomycetes bacterium]|nr:membrane integrity-associated transporter subunit PqiC [Planctomycetota bacterium]
MRTRTFLVAAGIAALLAGCGSVAVPSERFYRLAAPAPAEPEASRGGVLRVQDLQLSTALDSDCLMRQFGVQLEPRPLARWIAPLDRLVTDAMVLGLSRARVCDLVKGAADPGGEDWALRGRIVDFAEVLEPEGAKARVALELWLEVDGRMVFHDEFVAERELAGGSVEVAVDGLSSALQGVVGELIDRMRARDLFAVARARTAHPDAPAAGPAR